MQEISSSLLFIILILFAFGANHFFSKYADKISFVKSLIFCILGILIGPNIGFSILSNEVIDKLGLLTYFILGIVAFNTGLKTCSFELRSNLLLRTLGDSILQFVVISFCFLIIGFTYLANFHETTITDFNVLLKSPLIVKTFLFSLTLGVMSLFTSGPAHFFNKKDLRINTPVYDSILKISNFFEMSGIILLTLILFVLDFFILRDFNFQKLGLQLLLLLIAPLLGWLFVIFIGKERNDERMTLATLGGVLFSTGIGIILIKSYLFFPFLMGLAIAKLFKDSLKISKTLNEIEDPFSVLLIIIFSAQLNIPTLMTVLIAVAFVLFRYFYLLLTKDFIIGNEIKKKNSAIDKVGRGFIAQDAFVIGAASLVAHYLGDWGNSILFVAIISIVFNEFLGAGSINSLLVDSDEFKVDR